MAVPRGLEPLTFGLGNRCSVQLSYGTAARMIYQIDPRRQIAGAVVASGHWPHPGSAPAQSECRLEERIKKARQAIGCTGSSAFADDDGPTHREPPSFASPVRRSLTSVEIVTLRCGRPGENISMRARRRALFAPRPLG